MVKNKYSIPVHQGVRFELVSDQYLYLRKRVQVVTGPGEVTEVEVAVDMTLGEWNRLRKAVKKARSRKRERAVRKLATIERKAVGFIDVPLPDPSPV